MRDEAKPIPIVPLKVHSPPSSPPPGPGWRHKGVTYGSPNEVIEALEAELSVKAAHEKELRAALERYAAGQGGGECARAALEATRDKKVGLGPWIFDRRTGMVAVYPRTTDGKKLDCLEIYGDFFIFMRKWDWSENSKSYAVMEGDLAIARLVAAAPDLLEACKGALASWERMVAVDWGQVQAAVKKAEQNEKETEEAS